MNIKARGEKKDDFNTELAEEQLQSAGYQMQSALAQTLSSVLWTGSLNRDEKIATAETIIEQFSEAYLAFLPSYLDWFASEYGGGMELMGRDERERKEGRAISAANRKTIKTVHKHALSIAEHAASMQQLLSPLAGDEAGADEATTSKTQAGIVKSEPELLHSAAKSLEFLRSLIPTA